MNEPCFLNRNWLTLALAAFLTGCVVPLKYDVSVPQKIPPGSAGEIHKDIIELNFPDLTILAQVQAFDWDGTYLLRPLGVWLDFEPANGAFTLDTRLVTLKSDEEEALHAVSYLGPSTAWWSPRAFAAGCGPRRYHSGIAITNIGVSQKAVMEARAEAGIFRPSEKAVPIDGKRCFMFWFDTDPMPDHTFILSIGGVRNNGRDLRVPDIRFTKGTVSTVRGFP